MKVKFICGCGSQNFVLSDWTAHWKYGRRGKWRAIRHFLLTRIEVTRG